MRIIFFGSPDDAVHLLGSLITAGHDIVAVYTQPDRRVGRGRVKQATAVKIFSEQCGLDTFTPVNLRDDEVEFTRMSNIAADVFVVVAYGRILPIKVLGIPSLGVINVHPSLLPLYRGPSPVAAAILDGQSHTGVSVMLLDEGMDTGPILAQSLPINLSGRERRSELQTRLFKESEPLLLATLTKLSWEPSLLLFRTMPQHLSLNCCVGQMVKLIGRNRLHISSVWYALMTFGQVLSLDGTEKTSKFLNLN